MLFGESVELSASKIFLKGIDSMLSEKEKKYNDFQQALLQKRREALNSAISLGIEASLPNYDYNSPTYHVMKYDEWKIELPEWCLDQRNQMTGPADDIELIVKMINSGAPGVMLDLEDSMVNSPKHIAQGIQNCIAALEGNAFYFDKNGNKVGQQKNPVIFIRPRGLHMHQPDGSSASFYDVTRVIQGIKDFDKLNHPPCFYIPKSESAEEALWWRDLFRDISDEIGKSPDYIKCMALVESHPLAYQMEEFIYNLRNHIIGLNLGRWDYMASLIHFNISNPEWVLPDRNTIPHDVEFFQSLRRELVNTCHSKGILAIGGMTALFPSRKDAELNSRALSILEKDKKNESLCGFDGAWTGHPDQNDIAISQFCFPNNLSYLPLSYEEKTNLRSKQNFNQENITFEGTRSAIRTTIKYRYGVLIGKGASLLDGYMEDLATDRIYRLMIAQRIKHIPNHTVEKIFNMFQEETTNIIAELGSWDDFEHVLNVQSAAKITLESILTGQFDPR